MTRWTAVLSVLAATALGGCGFGSGDPVREQRPALLTKRQVERYQEGSPARAVFEWWRAVQFDNALVAARYYSRRLGITPKKLDRQLQYGATALNMDKRPQLVEVDQAGDEATVLLELEQATRNPNGRIDRVTTGRGFNLVREDGHWKLAENLYLERAVRLQRAFASAAARQRSEPGATTTQP